MVYLSSYSNVVSSLFSTVGFFFSDVHSPSGGDDDCNVLLSDVQHDTLATSIAENFWIVYFSRLNNIEIIKVARVVEGFRYGENDRTIVLFVVYYKENAH